MQWRNSATAFKLRPIQHIRSRLKWNDCIYVELSYVIVIDWNFIHAHYRVVLKQSIGEWPESEYVLNRWCVLQLKYCLHELYAVFENWGQFPKIHNDQFKLSKTCKDKWTTNSSATSIHIHGLYLLQQGFTKIGWLCVWKKGFSSVLYFKLLMPKALTLCGNSCWSQRY